MRIRVRLQGTLAGRTASPDDEVDLPDGGTVGDLVVQLGLPTGPYVTVIGGRAVSLHHQLADHDRVALYPPMAGG